MITAFDIAPRPSGIVCQELGARPIVLRWASAGGDGARISTTLLSIPLSFGVPTSGERAVCAVPGQSFTLTVTGPGGADSATLRVS